MPFPPQAPTIAQRAREKAKSENLAIRLDRSNVRPSGERSLKPFSLVHVADLHLGYAQYGMEVRREDFDRTFQELVDKTIELIADFMIIAGGLFHQARPSNITLENSARNHSFCLHSFDRQGQESIDFRPICEQKGACRFNARFPRIENDSLQLSGTMFNVFRIGA